MGVQPKRGVGLASRPLLESEIVKAQGQTRSGREAARYLNVHYDTYKRYATLYGLFDRHKNKAGVGVSRKKTKGTFGLDSILAGEHPTYDHNKLKERLVRAGYLEEKCSLCGFDRKRELDGRSPLILHCIDGNQHNLKRDNLELRCYNCIYLTTGKVSTKSILNPGVYEADALATGNLSLDDIERLQTELMGR